MKIPFERQYLSLAPFTQNVFFRLFSQLSVLVAGGLTNILLARWLGPEGKGIVYLAVLVPVMLYNLSSLGIGHSLIFLTARKKYTHHELTGNALAIAGVLIIVIAAVYFRSLDFLRPRLLKFILPSVAVPAFFIFPAMLLTGYLSSFLLGLQQIKKVFFLDVLKTSAGLILTAAFLFFGTGAAGAVRAAVISYFIPLAAAVVLAGRVSRLRPRFDPAVAGDLLGFGLKAHLGTMIQFLNYRLDMFLVGFFLSFTQVGIYSVSVLLAEMIWHFPNAVSEVLFPRTAGSDRSNAACFSSQICRSTLLVTLSAAALLGVVAHPVLRLFFGQAFVASLVPLWILLPGIVCLSVGKVLASDLVGRGKPMCTTCTAGIAFVPTLLLYLVLIPAWGINGAAFASSISYFLVAFVISMFYKRVSGEGYAKFLLPQAEDIAALKNIFRKIALS